MVLLIGASTVWRFYTRFQSWGLVKFLIAWVDIKIAGLWFVRGESVPRLTLRAVFLLPSRFQTAHAFTVKRRKHTYTLIQTRKYSSLCLCLSVCLFVSLCLCLSVYKIKSLFLDKTYLLFANWVSLKTLTNRPPTIDHLLTNQPTTKHRPTDHRPNAPTTRGPENIRIYIWHNLVTVRYWRKHLKWSMHAEIFSKEF